MDNWKGTKGEWALRDDFREPKVVNESGKVIFTHNKDCYDTDEDSHFYYSHNKMMANTQLVSAAPDLLDALQIYLNAGSKDQRKEASVIAKAAIEKALK